ncbi:MAG: low temperature requirement protein A [Gaiellaceae bacterium]
MSGAVEEDAPRVTTLELFFDLVFVLTITQLTSVLFRSPNVHGVARVVVMLGVIWWMYGGYVWMTNAVRANTSARRLLLLGGMGGFFVLSLAIPSAFAGSGLAFALAYFVVVLVHSVLFTRATAVSAARAILTLAPYNLGAAIVVVAGGAVGGRVQFVLWAAAGTFEWLTPWIRGTKGFVVAAAHFVERHALVVIIAIGESVVAIGFGTSTLPIDAALVGVALLGLALSACLWWMYFSGHEGHGEQALAALPVAERAWASLVAFGYWHLPMLFGILAIASVEREAAEHPFTAISWARAAILAAGAAAYCLGNALFRRTLRLDGARSRTVAGVVALATAPLGALASPTAQLAALVAVLVVSFVATLS